MTPYTAPGLPQNRPIFEEVVEFLRENYNLVQFSDEEQSDKRKRVNINLRKLSIDNIKSKNRHRLLVVARSLLAYYFRQRGESLNSIGRRLKSGDKKRDHATILNYWKVLEAEQPVFLAFKEKFAL